mgnify:CR=1 FL=1|jgi:type VI protein secretion system component VasK
MKKISSYTQTALLLIAIILSIVAVCRTYPRSANLGFDYLGIIIGILGILVTILLGWQLINALKLQNFAEEAEKAKDYALAAKDEALAKVENIESKINQANNRLEDLSKKIKELKIEVAKKLEPDDFSEYTENEIEAISQQAVNKINNEPSSQSQHENRT